MKATAAAKAVNLVRAQVRDLCSAARRPRAPLDRQRSIAQDTVNLVSYLAEPEGIRGDKLPNALGVGAPRRYPYAAALVAESPRRSRRAAKFFGPSAKAPRPAPRRPWTSPGSARP